MIRQLRATKLGMGDALPLLVVGLFLGMRHATDADHVVAITTITSRERTLRGAAMIGAVWASATRRRSSS